MCESAYHKQTQQTTKACNELLGCDIRTPEGVQYARDHHLFTEFCPKMVASAVEILEEIIRNRQ